MLIHAVLRLLPLPFPWRLAARGSERGVMPRPAVRGASNGASNPASRASEAGVVPGARGSTGALEQREGSDAREAGGAREISLAPGQWTLLKLPRGTVLHVHEGEACVEDAPRLWADHCWSEPRRLRAGEVCVLPRAGWWRIDGRAAGRTGGVQGGGASGACRISARLPAARRSHPRRPC